MKSTFRKMNRQSYLLGLCTLALLTAIPTRAADLPDAGGRPAELLAPAGYDNWGFRLPLLLRDRLGKDALSIAVPISLRGENGIRPDAVAIGHQGIASMLPRYWVQATFEEFKTKAVTRIISGQETEVRICVTLFDSFQKTKSEYRARKKEWSANVTDDFGGGPLKAVKGALNDALRQAQDSLRQQPWTTVVLDVEEGSLILASGEGSLPSVGAVLQLLPSGVQPEDPGTGLHVPVAPQQSEAFPPESILEVTERDDKWITARLVRGSLPTKGDYFTWYASLPAKTDNKKK